MVSKKLMVTNPVGLHLRPAGVFASEMMQFECDVRIVYKDTVVNAKSLLSIMAACIKCGAEILVECEGVDEEEALERAEELIESFED